MVASGQKDANIVGSIEEPEKVRGTATATADEDTTQLDRDLAAAQERVARKRAQQGKPVGPDEEVTPVGASPASRRSPRLTDQEKEEKAHATAEERQRTKDARLEERRKKREERASERPTPHLSKVAKAAKDLPDLSEAASRHYERLVKEKGLVPADLDVLGMHLQHHYRHFITEQASARKLEVGQQVRLTAPRMKGAVGKVVKLQRIRCYVKVEGQAGLVYVMTSETEDVEQDAPAAQTAES